MKVSLGARDIGRLLNGVLTVIKQKDTSVASLKRTLARTICEEGNSLGDLFVPLIKVPIVEPHPNSQALVVVGYRDQPDYSQHPLVAGFPLNERDVRIEELHYQSPASSGLCVLGINDGCDELDELRKKNWINCFQINSSLGQKRHDVTSLQGKIVASASYEHVTRHRLEKVFTRLKAQFKRASFELMHCDLQSEEAFEAARTGAVRPAVPDAPIVYEVVVKYFNAPVLGLEVQCTGASEAFLTSFIHEIGRNVDTYAAAKRIYCNRIGPLLAENALLQKNFNLRSILGNLMQNRKIIGGHQQGELIKSTTATLLPEKRKEEMGEESEECVKMSWARHYTPV
ncbi:hypothetical protein L596_014936 [Steinernema carpocapsae]|uniref:Pseudouridine synthase II N-terminal domain-containing protein n=1 Tax=Steinernema carpocapsae TaxID=34508 RepID=A0A4U5NEC0_STECR|nr:hypothetical protein L596_014936 [Steinernema carpocapsae]